MGKLKVFSVWLFTEEFANFSTVSLYVSATSLYCLCVLTYVSFLYGGYICPVALTLGQSLKFSDFHAYIHTMSRIAASSL